MAEEKTFSVGVQTSSPKRISVTSNVSENPITASADTGLYYSQLSKNWAIGDGLIQNEDYSSKTWAAESKRSADLSKMYSEAASLDYNNLSEAINQYNEQISGVVAEGLETINTSVTGGVETIETTKTEASEYVETTANESIAEVNQAKEQAIKDFNKASDKVNYLFVMPIGHIGISPFPIDETKGLQRLLNGQTIIQEQFTGFTKWLKEKVALYPSVVCTEEQWQATVTMSAFGQCGKFVINDEAGTIRLPKITGFIQGLTDLASLGNLVGAGLPTHTHTRGTMNIVGWGLRGGQDGGGGGAFYKANTGQSNANSGNYGADYNFDASRNWTGETSVPNNATYGKSNTVQPESIRYPYFIQVATGAEESVDVTREIELNNPFSLLDYKFSEYELNNLSWLRSNGQYNSKAVYPAVYDLLLKIYNGTETKVGVSVKLSTETFTDYDFVLNTAEETFKLPIKVKLASGKAVVGNGMTLGLSNGNGGAGLYSNQQGSLYGFGEGYGTNVGSKPSTINYYTDFTLGVTTDPTKSGIETSDSDLYLYFYVGETVQNANLINAGRIEEKITEALAKPHITETYRNGSSWYRVYSDGFIEQGGYASTTATPTQINFLKPYTNTSPMISIQITGVTATGNYSARTAPNSTYFQVQTSNPQNANSTGIGFGWYACGY